jgi:hypothetical protein
MLTGNAAQQHRQAAIADAVIHNNTHPALSGTRIMHACLFCKAGMPT